MTRCPVCGAWIWINMPHVTERIICKSCGATLKHHGDARGILWQYGKHGILEDIFELLFSKISVEEYPKDEPYRPLYADRRTDAAETYGEPYKPLYADRRKEHQKEHPAAQILPREHSTAGGIFDGRCRHCDATVKPMKENFCHNCGALLTRELSDLKPVVKRQEAGGKQNRTIQQQIDKCVVCESTLNQGDDVVWCPQCGRLAHRTHLVEWIRQKKCCPACGEKLEERYYE